MAVKDHLAVRLDAETIERVAVVQEVLSTEWHPATTSDALRAAILAGLDALEKEHGPRMTEVRTRRGSHGGEKHEPPIPKKAPEAPIASAGKQVKKAATPSRRTTGARDVA